MELNISFDPTDREQTQRAKEILDGVDDTLDATSASDDEADTLDLSEPEADSDRSDAADDDADTDDPEPELDANLRPGTWAFRAASVLYHHADDRLSASDVEDALDGTEWKHQNPQNISRDLKRLYDDGIAEREEVKTDSGHDYFAFWLTPAGHRLVEDIEAPDDVTAYADVADRGLGALFNGTETEPNEGET
jgi:DNA-binding HxlR family transcriptional regulator